MSINVKISSGSPELSSIFLRQTPSGSGIWADHKFFVNEHVERCDWWIICHQSAVQKHEVTICDPGHIVFISMEPTEGSTPHIFYKQFSKLLLCDRSIQHPDIQYVNGTTWWTGIQVKFEECHKFLPTVSQDYDTFKKMSLPIKQNRISVICSNNKGLPGHRKRLEFLDKLRLHPIARHIDFYGGGHNHVFDKLDAIAPYKYHLVLENSVVPDYWSEKLGDPLLGFALPIYYGCPNIEKYFSKKSLIQIDIDDFEKTVATMERIIKDDIYESYLPAIIEARNLILDRYNIFQLMADVCNAPATRFVQCSVRPAGHLVRSWPRRLARKWIHRLRGIQSD